MVIFIAVMFKYLYSNLSIDPVIIGICLAHFCHFVYNNYNKYPGFTSLMGYNLIDHVGYFIEYAKEWNPVFIDIPEVLENNLLLLHANI
jgi:hypothetical protein